MPNIAAVLRDEIQRLARKEVRATILPMKKHRAEDRSAIAALRRQVAALEREIAFLRKQEKRRIEVEPAAADADGVRFSPKWLASDRKRLGLSAKDYGALVGVSMLTIYNWEKGKSKPRAKQLAAWAQVRGIGKREAMRRLELLET
jgi:DNA-binding transcriptional regulator YiaG